VIYGQHDDEVKQNPLEIETDRMLRLIRHYFY